MEDKIKELKLKEAANNIRLSPEKIENIKKAVNEKGRKNIVSKRTLPKRRYVIASAFALCLMLFLIIDMCIYKVSGSSATGIIIQKFTDKSITEAYDEESAEYISSKRQIIGDIITGEYFQCKIVDAVYDDVFDRLIYSVNITGIDKEYAECEGYLDSGNMERNRFFLKLKNKSGNIEVFFVGGGRGGQMEYDEIENSLCVYVKQNPGDENCFIGLKKWAGSDITAQYDIKLDIFDKIESLKVSYEGTDITITPFALGIGRTYDYHEINEIEISYKNGYVSRPILYGYFNDLEYESLNAKENSPNPGDVMYFKEVRDIKDITMIRVNGKILYKR